ncbi:LysR substrate-binding domain-containing protein [Nocardioides sp. CFH 31398]|uniref:LysR substrate-binding domain-containing protein n=1 Tax=Nocardioides sp. CFH 31398 TaxID=2919579 RepID=UPI001F0645D3|nr:LysR substrate-binding domain-containing protein [Nocardioides sp. CFH 31398]MCH1866378.1 LysR substrate-binding domain-containing protein [Nocardioides sp. CFH 31398]
MDLDTRRLRVFLAVADELHFSRAAARLHLSQPALSQQVRLLERDLGVALFTRTSRQVGLTLAGEALQQAAPRVLHEADRAVEAAQQAAHGVTGRITIGSVRTGLASVLPAVMRAFTVDHPRVRFDLVHMDTALQLRALADRSIDVGIVRAAAPTPGLVVEPLVSEPLMLALPAGHALAGPGSPIDPAALADELFVSWPRHLGVEFSDIVVAYCRGHGFSPDVVSEGGDIDTQLALVAAGFGVSLQPAFYASACPAGVVFRPLLGSPPQVALQMAWRRDGAPAVVVQLVETARRLRDSAEGLAPGAG